MLKKFVAKLQSVYLRIKYVWLTLLVYLYKFLHFLRSLLPAGVRESEVKKLHQELSIDATWNLNYIAFTLTACLIATFGLISNSTAVIIGAMLIAPLMLPLRGLAFSALEGDFPLFVKAFLSVTGATVTSIFLSWLIGTIASLPEFGSEVLSRTQPNLVDLGIAVTAGGISGFAKIRKEVSDALAGTAISVALMPPLCVVGLSLSQGILALSRGAFLLYLTNLLGITLACMLIFILAGYTEANHALGWTLALNAILFIPLGISFWELVQHAELQETLRSTLLNKTTILRRRDINIVHIDIDWNVHPPIAVINVQTQEEITPKQVSLVQEFVSQEMNQEFRLEFVVDRVEVILPEATIDLDDYIQPRLGVPPSQSGRSAPSPK